MSDIELYSLSFVATAIPLDSDVGGYRVGLHITDTLRTEDVIDMMIIAHELEAVACKIRERALFSIAQERTNQFIETEDKAL